MRRPFGIYLVAAWLAVRLMGPLPGVAPGSEWLKILSWVPAVILLVKLVQLHGLARIISVCVFCYALFQMLYISVHFWPALVFAALDTAAIVYLLRSKFARFALEYREWRLDELKARTVKRLLKKDRLR